VRHPQVFLFDEPLSNLDAQLRVQMRVELKRLHERLETTAIYVTHDQVEAMTLADRVVVLRDGAIEQTGSPLALYDQPANQFVAQFIGTPQMNVIDTAALPALRGVVGASPSQDGFIGVLPYAPKHWTRFMEIVGRADIAAEPWFGDPAARSERIHQLCQIIDEAMPAKTTAEWLKQLRAADIPCGPINQLEDLFSDPHLASSGFFQTEEHPTEGPLRFTRHPLDFNGVGEQASRPAPQMGQHNRDILAEAGLSAAEIDALEVAGVLGRIEEVSK